MTDTAHTGACCGAARAAGPALTIGTARESLVDKAAVAVPQWHRESVRLPGGEFAMGTDVADGFPDDVEGQVRQVTVAAFTIDRCAVTNARFAEFVDATGYVTEAQRRRPGGGTGTAGRILVQFSVCDAAIGSPYGGFAIAEREAALRLIAGLRSVPLQPLRWPADPTRLYAGLGLAVAIGPADQASTVDGEPTAFVIYAGSRHRSALRPLREPGFDWEHFTG